MKILIAIVMTILIGSLLITLIFPILKWEHPRCPNTVVYKGIQSWTFPTEDEAKLWMRDDVGHPIADQCYKDRGHTGKCE